MNFGQSSAGTMQKIGYSFVGLLAGNVAMAGVLLFLAAYCSLRELAIRREDFSAMSAIGVNLTIALIWELGIGRFSLVGWLLVGLPTVLSINAEFVRRLHWLLVLLIGGALGPPALLLVFFVFDHGHLDIASIAKMKPFLVFSMIVSASAFGVYCALVRRALREIA